MPTKRKVLHRQRRGELTFGMQQELWMGPSPQHGSVFEGVEHVKATWFRHREKMMRQWGCHGKRPVAWWFFEAAQYGLPPRHPGKYERSILFEFGGDALTLEERAELEAYWKKEFDRSFEPGFTVLHEGEIVAGQGARELHWVFVDLPPPLHARFMAERKRQRRTIRGLEREDPEDVLANADAAVLDDDSKDLAADDGEPDAVA